MTKPGPKNRKLYPWDIKDKDGQPLRECDLSHVWIESQKLGRRLTALELLNIQASLVKPIYDEVSKQLTQLDAVIERLGEDAEGTFIWQRMDKARSKTRGFYNTNKQVWAIRKAEHLEHKRQQGKGTEVE